MTGSQSVNADTSPLPVRRSAGREAEHRADSGQDFQSAVSAAGRGGQNDSVKVASDEGQETEAETPGLSETNQAEPDPALGSLLADIDRRRTGSGMEMPALGQPVREAFRNGSDAAQSVLYRAAVTTEAFAVPDEMDAGLQAIAKGGEGPGTRTRVDLVSMRTDFQPAETVALDGRVRSVGPTLTAIGFGRVLASADARADVNHADKTETLGDADWQGGDPTESPGGLRHRRPSDADVRIAGKGEKGESKMATVNGTVAADHLDADKTALADPLVGERPTRQVASAVTSALADHRPASGTLSEDGRLHLRVGGAALKTIQIQLQPEQLGKLDVTMRLVNGQLAIHLIASEAETALRLTDDADSLKSLLAKAGFTVDDAAISFAVRDPAAQRSPSGMATGGGGAANDHRANDGASGEGAGRFAQGESSREGPEHGPRRPPTTQVQAGASASRRDHDPSTYL